MSEICPEEGSQEMVRSVIARIGSKDPIACGGGRIFDTNNGPFLELTLGNEVDGEVIEVYCTHMGDDICEQFDRLLKEGGLEEMCECMDEKPSVWKRKARGRLTLRAKCIIDLANHFGWDEIDPEPLELSEVELQLRWFSTFNLEGSVTTAKCTNPRVVIPELLLALQELDKAAHDELFARHFPLVPSAAMQNKKSLWWGDVGPDVAIELAKMLKDRCPPKFKFSWDNRRKQYGFWPKRRAE